MKALEEDVVVKAKTNRILAIDLLRGYFLLVIIIDHVELYPSGWDFLTGRGRLWVSAAEGFFFMSGLLIGMVYKRRLHLGMKFIFRKMWKRALELYVLSVALTFLFLCWVEFTHHAPIKDTLPNPFPWHHYIIQTLLTRFTYGWADFLIHFAVLMVIAPFVFYLLARRKWWLAVFGILIAWIFRGEHFTLAWQIIFNSGIIMGFYWQDIVNRFRSLGRKKRRKIKRVFASFAATTFIISYASVFLLTLLNYFYGSLTPWLRHVTFTWNDYNADIWDYADKWKIGPLRILLFFAWFTVLYWVFHKYERQIGKATRGLLELLGRNSLFVYIAHAFIVFILKMYFIPPHTNFGENFLITTVAVITLVLLTISYKRLEARFTLKNFMKLQSLFNR